MTMQNNGKGLVCPGADEAVVVTEQQRVNAHIISALEKLTARLDSLEKPTATPTVQVQAEPKAAPVKRGPGRPRKVKAVPQDDATHIPWHDGTMRRVNNPSAQADKRRKYYLYVLTGVKNTDTPMTVLQVENAIREAVLAGKVPHAWRKSQAKPEPKAVKAQEPIKREMTLEQVMAFIKAQGIVVK